MNRLVFIISVDTDDEGLQRIRALQETGDFGAYEAASMIAGRLGAPTTGNIQLLKVEDDN